MKTLSQIFITFSIVLGSNFLEVKGQVGIGTNTPDSSAILELSSSNKAFYLSRVALTGTDDTTTIPNPKAGFLILNIASASVGTSTEVIANQIYGHDGTQWVKLINEATLEEALADVKIPQLGGYAYYNSAQNFTELSGNVNVISFPSANTEELFSETLFKRTTGSDSQFEVVKAGKFVFTGFLNWALHGIVDGGPTFWTAGVQKSTDGGATWVYITGIRCPYISDYAGYTTNCSYSGVGNLTVGDKVRFIAQKRNGATPTTGGITANTSLGVPYSAGFNVTVYTN